MNRPHLPRGKRLHFSSGGGHSCCPESPKAPFHRGQNLSGGEKLSLRLRDMEILREQNNEETFVRFVWRRTVTFKNSNNEKVSPHRYLQKGLADLGEFLPRTKISVGKRIKRGRREKKSPPKMNKKTRSNKPPEEEESEEMEIGETRRRREESSREAGKAEDREQGLAGRDAKMRKEVKEMELEKARLEERLEERREIVGMLREMVKEGGKGEEVGRVEEGVSFAQVVRDEGKERKRNPVVTGTRREPVKAPNVVIIRKEGKGSEEVRKKMKEVGAGEEEADGLGMLRAVCDGVIVLIIRYGCEVWAEALKDRAIRRKLMSAQRTILLGMAMAYATVSHEAIRVVAAEVPWDL
ncbi:hypothetical protein J6590_036246 [Homalodisca vitripennis]|nr:hypothetical protein J6590_036246 [Homalodisca vitripennis]